MRGGGRRLHRRRDGRHPQRARLRDDALLPRRPAAPRREGLRRDHRGQPHRADGRARPQDRAQDLARGLRQGGRRLHRDRREGREGGGGLRVRAARHRPRPAHPGHRPRRRGRGARRPGLHRRGRVRAHERAVHTGPGRLHVHGLRADARGHRRRPAPRRPLVRRRAVGAHRVRALDPDGRLQPPAPRHGGPHGSCGEGQVRRRSRRHVQGHDGRHAVLLQRAKGEDDAQARLRGARAPHRRPSHPRALRGRDAPGLRGRGQHGRDDARLQRDRVPPPDDVRGAHLLRRRPRLGPQGRQAGARAVPGHVPDRQDPLPRRRGGRRRGLRARPLPPLMG
mmetsp:Transcript_23798/g.71389  ORF Transcript_23798/g.71389 Transcript_23798/m.71389 type:complete len:337 (+) Transcript_23798:903-1913(+)